MAISIDGKIHKTILILKYGQDFPKPNRSMNITSDEHGEILVYIRRIGIPKWGKGITVKVPIEY